MDLTPAFARAHTLGADSLESQALQGGHFKGLKGAFVSWGSTREMFQEGMPLRT